MSTTGSVGNPPKWLGQGGRECWRTIKRELERQGRPLWALDRPLLSVACQIYQHIQKLDGILASEGYIVEGPRGKVQAHPIVRTRNAATRVFLDYLKALGVPPSVRARISTLEGLSGKPDVSGPSFYYLRRVK